MEDVLMWLHCLLSQIYRAVFEVSVCPFVSFCRM